MGCTSLSLSLAVPTFFNSNNINDNYLLLISAVLLTWHIEQISLSAGDDAQQVRWQDLNSSLKLYASHSSIVATVAQKRGAHWW